MANRPINITGIDPNDNTKLVLSDNGNTSVDPSDTVTWNIQNNSGVSAIVAIQDKYANDPTSPDVFNPDPAPWPNSNSSSWRGTVNGSIAANSAETYFITWTPSDGSANRTYDPIIRVNP